MLYPRISTSTTRDESNYSTKITSVDIRVAVARVFHSTTARLQHLFESMHQPIAQISRTWQWTYLRLGIPHLPGRYMASWFQLDAPEDNSILAFSCCFFQTLQCHSILTQINPSSFLNSSANQLIITWSKPSPPKEYHRQLILLRIRHHLISKIEISKVPPPRSNTAIFISLPPLSNRKPC